MKLKFSLIIFFGVFASINLEAPRRRDDRKARRDLDIKQASLGGLAIPNNPVFTQK